MGVEALILPAWGPRAEQRVRGRKSGFRVSAHSVSRVRSLEKSYDLCNAHSLRGRLRRFSLDLILKILEE
eukprot:scaffold870_cov268-Pinguiococcus_pyrenoidosus.AAC.73